MRFDLYLISYKFLLNEHIQEIETACCSMFDSRFSTSTRFITGLIKVEAPCKAATFRNIEYSNILKNLLLSNSEFIPPNECLGLC